MNRMPRRKHLGFLMALLAMVAMFTAGPATGTHTSAEAIGGGGLIGTLTRGTGLWAPDTSNPTQPKYPCAEYTQLKYDSAPGYSVTYKVVDTSGNSATYSGPVTTSYTVSETTYENPLGSFDTSTKCRAGTPLATFTNVSGSLAGTLGSTSIDCIYTSPGVWGRDKTTATVELSGSCTVDDGTQPPVTGSTHEQRVADMVPVGPAPTTTAGVERLTAS